MSWPRGPARVYIGSDAGDVDHLYPPLPSESEDSVHPARFATATPPFFDAPAWGASESGSAASEPENACETGELWECFKSSALVNRWSDELNSWVCYRCGSTELYNTKRPRKQLTPRGTWIYVPNVSSPAETPNVRTYSQPSPVHSLPARPKPEPPAWSQEDGEFPESETDAQDPSVDPETLQPLPSRRRRRRQRPEDQPTRARVQAAERPQTSTRETPHEPICPRKSWKHFVQLSKTRTRSPEGQVQIPRTADKAPNDMSNGEEAPRLPRHLGSLRSMLDGNAALRFGAFRLGHT